MVESINAQIQALIFETRAMRSKSSEELDQVSHILLEIRQQIDLMRSEKTKSECSADDIESLTTRVSSLRLTAQRYVNEHEFLASLHYMQRPVRHENITEAHKTTFSWTLMDVDTQTGEANRLVSWLKEGKGVFWVSGRPGSGKSTFMKYIADHQKTNSLLSLWANGGALIKACHYFWSPGTEVQRSNEGLLRSLLYEIFSQNSELIRIICPGRWLQATSTTDSSQAPWSLSELRTTIGKIANQAHLPIKFCFFIDGLDEFSGDHLQLCESLIELSRCAGVKLVVSSRQWNVFQDSLGSNPAKILYLHELTEGDIRKFTESQLLEHPNWHNLELEAGRDQALSLVADINTRSRGVFLWVYLVTRLLRAGLTNYDTLADLKRRLEGIPTNLGNFFRLMLESVEPFYHTKMAGTLQLALTANEPLPVIIYSFHDLEYEDVNYAIKEKLEPWTKGKSTAFKAPFTRRLSSRCKGLLEIQGGKVEFLHRTVRDFLLTAEMRDFIASKLPSNFNASCSIFRAYVAWIKHKNFFGVFHEKSYVQEQFCRVLDKALSYARENGSEADMVTLELLDDLDLSTSIIFDTPDYGDQNYLPEKKTHNPFVTLYRHRALRAGLASYVERKLDQDSNFLECLEIPPLAAVLGLDMTLEQSTSSRWFDQRVELVRLLLDRGANPNESYTNPNESYTNPNESYPYGVRTVTPWSSLFAHLMRTEKLGAALDKGVVYMLLKFGADPNVFLNPGLPVVFAGFQTLDSLPIWALWLSLVFSGKETLIYTKSYIQVLTQMLVKANFGTSGKNVIVKAAGLSQSQFMAREVRGRMRHVVFDLVATSMRHIKSKKINGDHYSLPYIQALAKAMSIFLVRAAHPSLNLDELQRNIPSIFPSGLANPLLDVIRDNYGDQEKNSDCRKRKRTAGNSGKTISTKTN